MFERNMRRLKTYIYSYILCIDSFKPTRLVFKSTSWGKIDFYDVISQS